MPELETVEPQKTAGFVSRSRSKYKDKIAKDEQELKELLAQRKEKGFKRTLRRAKMYLLLKRERKQRYLMRLSARRKNLSRRDMGMLEDIFDQGERV